MFELMRYPFSVWPLFTEDGGGFLISSPNFSECISDGETVEEALRNGLDALQKTIAALKSMNLPVPELRGDGVVDMCLPKMPASNDGDASLLNMIQ